jgi:hypothetical protein
MGILSSWLGALTGSKERSSDFLEVKKENTITRPPRWSYDFIPKSVIKHLTDKGCTDITKVTDQITKYGKDQEVGNSVMLQFDFNVPQEYEQKIKVRNVNDELLTILSAVELEDEVTTKVLQSINGYNVSKKKKYVIKIDPLYFEVECFFDKQSRTKRCKYQLTFRIFYNPS